MTSEEQEAIVGRTVREANDWKLTVGLANKQLSDFADFLNKLSDEIRERIPDPKPKENDTPIEIPPDISRLVNFDRIFALISDRDKAFRKLADVQKLLKQMGVTV